MAILRMMLTKGEDVRYISHLDYAKAVERALRRAKLPVAYSEGFNPHLKMSFASALAVGVTSDGEYLDVELTREVDLKEVQEQLTSSFGTGIKILKARYIKKRKPALMSVINLAAYEISGSLDEDASLKNLRSCVDKFNSAASILFVKESPKGRRQVDVKNFMAKDVTISKKEGCEGQSQSGRLILNMSIRVTPAGSIKPIDVLGILIDTYKLPVDKRSLLIKRTGLYIEKDNIQISPLDYE